MSKTLMILWAVLVLTLWSYSYGFVDFNLTLSSHPLVMQFVRSMQQLALFNRPTSLLFFLGLMVVSFTLYFFTVKSYRLPRFPWKVVLILALVLALAYPFLSSDVFKYLFGAKTVLVYHQNPNLVAPQVFEGDLWLRFMRWIHTPSPYGPVQTLLAIPYYLLGFGKFVPILYLYKLDQVFWYGLSIWALGKLGASPRARLFFALNPLVLYEWLINAHNDAPMIGLALLALVLMKNKNRYWATLSLATSIGIKFVTLIFIPFLLFPSKLISRYLSPYSLIVLTLAPLLYHYQIQYQPWYVTWLVPFAALSNNKGIMWVVGAYTLGALLRYIPYIQTGLWEGTPLYFASLTFLPPLLMALGYNGVHAALSQTKKN